MPNCPDDLSEAAYASLIFEKECKVQFPIILLFYLTQSACGAIGLWRHERPECELYNEVETLQAMREIKVSSRVFSFKASVNRVP